MLLRTVYLFLFLLQSSLFFGQDTTSVELLPVEIRAERAYASEKISLSRSHFLSAPASFDDPSRLLMKYPGFSVSNDQNNAIIYDGLPSHYSTWSLYGAQIANPNHLSNAGTANDRPSRSSGGVNMFSGQVIGELDYHTGSSGPAHGIGGVADMSIRTPFQNSITANLSLIGLEAGIDRVLDDGKSSLLANYRYSTVGLLDRIGVELGDEIINYQDAIINFKKKWSDKEISVVAIYGKSSNDHTATKLQSDDDAIFKDIQDINYGAYNLTSAIHLKAASYQLTLAYSSRDENKSNRYEWNDKLERSTSNVSDKIISLYLLSKVMTGKFRLQFKLNGSFYNQWVRYINSRDRIEFLPSPWPENGSIHERSIFFNENYYDLRPSMVVNYSLNSNHKLELASQLYYNSFNSKMIPLFDFSYESTNTTWVNRISFGKNAQMQSPEILGANNTDFTIGSSTNRFLPALESYYGSLYSNYKNIGVRMSIRKLLDVTGNFRNDLMSLNDLSVIPIEIKNQFSDVIIGSASVFGKLNIGEYNVNSTLTIMDAMSNGDYKQIPYNYGQKWNISVDKKFIFNEKKSLRISMLYTIRNGYYQDVINEEESRDQHITVYGSLASEESNVFRLSNYSRLDLRLSYIKKGKWKNVISLDIQNVLNRQNDAYYYFDPVLDETVLQKQLGLIPILSWRVVF